MKLWILIGLVTISYAKTNIQDSSDLLKVSIYYESLCPDSIRFITKQLYPAYDKIGSSLLVDFVPYGKATHVQENGKWTFKCQHGPNECWGNKAQACGLAEKKGQDKDVDFVNCVMDQSNPANESTITKCSPKLDVPAQTILDCSKSEKGDELLARHGDQTHAVQPKITFVPTIIFNDVYDSEIQKNCLNNFLETACGVLENKPSGCPSDANLFMGF